MTQPLTDDHLSWLGRFSGISLKPLLGAGGQGASQAPVPGLSLSPELVSDAFKMGLQDGVQHAPPRFKVGEGPLSDAYWQGYTGKAGPVAAPPPAGSDQPLSKAFTQGLQDGMKHLAPQVPQGDKDKADYQRGYDAGWPPLLRVSPMPVGPPAGTPGEADAKDGPKPAKGDGPDVAVSADPAHKKPGDRKVSTEVTYTIALRATDESDPPNVQALPDMELTVGLDSPDKPPDIEAQVNVLKANITGLVKKQVNLKGRVKVEATVGFSAKLDTAAAGAGQLAAALQTKIKAELEITILNTVKIKPGVEIGPDHQLAPGVTLEIPLPKALQ